MPWKPGDARRHTRKANSAKKKRQWRDVANSALRRGQSEGAAVRQANAVVAGTARHHGRKTAKRRHRRTTVRRSSRRR